MVFDITHDFTPALIGLAILLAGTVLLIRQKSAVINETATPETPSGFYE